MPLSKPSAYMHLHPSKLCLDSSLERGIDLQEGTNAFIEAPAPFSAFCPVSQHLEGFLCVGKAHTCMLGLCPSMKRAMPTHRKPILPSWELASVAWHTSVCFFSMCGQSPHIEKKHTLVMHLSCTWKPNPWVSPNQMGGLLYCKGFRVRGLISGHFKLNPCSRKKRQKKKPLINIKRPLIRLGLL